MKIQNTSKALLPRGVTRILCILIIKYIYLFCLIKGGPNGLAAQRVGASLWRLRHCRMLSTIHCHPEKICVKSRASSGSCNCIHAVKNRYYT